jgi:hypothetical protein
VTRVVTRAVARIGRRSGLPFGTAWIVRIIVVETLRWLQKSEGGVHGKVDSTLTDPVLIHFAIEREFRTR